MDINIIKEHKKKHLEIINAREVFIKDLEKSFPYIFNNKYSMLCHSIEKDFVYIWRSLTDLKAKRFKLNEEFSYRFPYNGLYENYASGQLRQSEYEIEDNNFRIKTWRRDSNNIPINRLRNNSGINKENFDTLIGLLAECQLLLNKEQYVGLNLEDKTIAYNRESMTRSIIVGDNKVLFSSSSYSGKDIFDICETISDTTEHIDNLINNFDSINEFFIKINQEYLAIDSKLEIFYNKIHKIANVQRVFEGLKA